MQRFKAFIEKIKNKERGAIVAEATIALTAFIFAIYLVLSVVDICYVQAKMGIALNSAAKEMSQYAYLYDAFDLYEFNGEGGKSSELIGSFSKVLDEISDGASNFSSDIASLFSTGSNKAEGDSASEYLKNGLGMALARQCVKKNLVSYEGDTAEAFLRRCHVKGGLNGLNFLNTTFLTDANQSEISIIVSYKVQVIRLLGTEYTFNFVQRADTKAWGKGVSLKNGDEVSTKSVWDAGNLSRGNSIIASEKKKYTYTSSSHNFHAYDTSKNQFVRIVSVDTTSNSYAGDTSAIENVLKQSYSNLTSGVEKLEKNVPVVNSAGKDVTVQSDKSTRTYKIVLVVPDSADMETVNAAVNNFKQQHPGTSVEVKTGYGNPTSTTKTETDKSSETTENS